MKVLIVNNMAPFIWGGAEELAVNLERNLIAGGYEAEVLRIPFQWEPATGIPAQIMLTKALEVRNVDRVIAFKFPAYMIPHERKTLWLLHQYRQAYDLYDAGYTNIHGPTAGNIRRYIRDVDNETFAECDKIFTNSNVTRDRLKKYNGFDASVLYPPVNDSDRFECKTDSGYIFAGGRINDLKRQYLLLEGLKFASSDVRLIIGGPPESFADEIKLRRLIERNELEDRVTLDIGFLTRDCYADYVNNATAVAYLPFDEDSLGYVAMEAATAHKPIITTRDSGGILGLVHPGRTGWVAEPTAQSLSDVMSQVFSNRSRAKSMGDAANALWSGMGVNWPDTIKRLIS